MGGAFIGIDPGITGAACLLGVDNSIELYDWTNVQEAAEKLREWYFDNKVLGVAIEDVHAISYTVTNMSTGKTQRFSQKGTSNFKFGENSGMWKGILTALNIPFTCVTPQKWQAGVIPRKTKKSDKPSFLVAKERYPHAPLKFKTKHHNRADAIMIVDWLRRQIL